MREAINIDSKQKFSSDPMISIIIPTFNSEKTLAPCLQSIQNQTYPNVETIMVDNCSQDNTVQISKKFNAEVLLLRGGRCSARNLGAREARGNFIFFVDSDMELTSALVEECATMCLQKSVDAVTIPEVSIGKGFVAECRKKEKEMHAHLKFSEAPRFFRKEVFCSVGGYDENLVSGEDFDLRARIEKAGYKIERCKAEIRHLEGELSMKRLVLKVYHYGKTLPSYARKNPLLAMKTSSPIHIFQNFRLFFRYPLHFMGLIAIKLIEYMAYSAGMLSIIFGG